MSTVTEAKQGTTNLVRDAGYGKRLSQACDASFHCPAINYGRLAWIRSELAKPPYNVTASFESVRKWLSGQVKPRQHKSDKLAQLLGVDPTWLYLGVDQNLSPREAKVRNAMADGVVNVVAGFIQMDGGYPAFPEDGDTRAKNDFIDLYAIIKGANYGFHVALGRDVDGGVAFSLPADHGRAISLGVVRRGFSVEIVELTSELIEEAGENTGGGSVTVTLTDDQVANSRLESFANRL